MCVCVCVCVLCIKYWFCFPGEPSLVQLPLAKDKTDKQSKFTKFVQLTVLETLLSCINIPFILSES